MLPDRTPSNDKGDDVQLRFRYQHSFTSLLAIQMYSKQIDFKFKEIFCEHHEDILAVSPDGKYTGIQIKTREDLTPFSLNDEAIKASIVRFTKLEEQFPDDFVRFVIISNCGFRNELAEDIGQILNAELLDSEQIQLKRKIKRYIRKISEKYKTDMSITGKVLSKLARQIAPSLYGAESKIIEGYLGNLPECKNLNLEDLRIILAQIRELVYNASSRKIADSVSDYISLVSNGRKTAKELEIKGKRITPKQIGYIIEWNINRIRQANRKKDSSLQLVDIDIVDDNGNVFPYLDIKVRNVGHKIAVLKKAELHVYRTWTLRNPWRPRALRSFTLTSCST